MKSYKEFIGESKLDINTICKEWGIKNYTINEDGSIDVDDNVDLFIKNLTELPLNFKNVTGYFDCSYNKLTSLVGCPENIGGNFDIRSNNLTSLEGCPESVGSVFDCSDNELTSLEGCPQDIGGIFNFHHNNVKDLRGFPEFFGGRVYYVVNPVSEILGLFVTLELGPMIDLINEYDVIRGEGAVVVMDRLEEVILSFDMELPKNISFNNYEVI